jgi:hypothetical protein
MSHPLIWPPVDTFYPVGNTSAVCLTQDLAPEQDADILLLGCGDPRSVLYTVYSDLKVKDGVFARRLCGVITQHPCLGVSRKLDITCCDWDPAVLGE